ncbi:MAG: glycosyl transferase [Alphaproteobacteria bacterium]|jgi:alpha-N-acetylglucosamine transferase|nr:glycosyl transferase [Alphaproteobacteria bacterium]
MAILDASRAPSAQVAYVTLLANDDYLPGAVALLRSIRHAGTDADIVVMYTDGVSGGSLDRLGEFAPRLVRAPLLELSAGFQERHARGALHQAAPFAKGRKPLFHSPLANFCKLRLWQLTEYQACVFLDADTVMLRSMDKLFAYPEFCGAPNVYERLSDFHRLNSGVFTARPCEVTFAAMMERLDRPGVFWPRTDQTFLQSFFPDWHGLPVFCNMLQYVWFNLPDLWNWDAIYLIHYQYEKPWEADNPKRDQLAPLIDLWRAFHDGREVPDFSALPPAPGAGRGP